MVLDFWFQSRSFGFERDSERDFVCVMKTGISRRLGRLDAAVARVVDWTQVSALAFGFGFCFGFKLVISRKIHADDHQSHCLCADVLLRFSGIAED